MTTTLIITIYHSQLISKFIPEWKYSDEKLAQILTKNLGDLYHSDVNVVFNSTADMISLNMNYRGIDSATDVLSFGYDDHSTPGEIYVCPGYISKSYNGTSAVEEILRCIVHGFLHLSGEEHKSHFTPESTEDMFVKQEKLLASIINELNN